MSFTVYPAIDIRHGRVVRLRQGDYAQETQYSDEPLALATRHAEQGAEWLHLVDLDAARVGGYTLTPTLRALKKVTRLRVQTGGGVRSMADIEVIFAAGADRVVIGSLAIREPDQVIACLRDFGPERITVALDARCDADGVWRLPSHGWTAPSAQTLDALAQRYAAAGLRHLLCTDITRDGMLAGPNFPLYRWLSALLPGVAVQASGGVRDVEDVRATREAGCAGAVLGKALLDGQLALVDALAC